MKILYNNTTGKIYYTVRDSDYYWFEHSTNVPLTVLDSPETEENKVVNKDLMKQIGHRVGGKEDDTGAGKYTVDKGVVKEKENWVQSQLDGII